MASGNLDPKKVVINNFLGGIAWGVGSVLGATIVVGLVFWFLHFINFVPILGNFAADVLSSIQTKQIQK
jgi:hypothetical protein